MSLGQLQEELNQLRETLIHENRLKSEKKIEKIEASEKLEDAGKQLEQLENQARETEKQLREKQAGYEEELRKLQKRNDDMRGVVIGFQQRLDRSKEDHDQVQKNLQIKNELPPTNINFLREAEENPNCREPSDLSYACHIIVDQPYVLKVGQALLTFEDEEVARHIISKGRHAVDMEHIIVDIKAVEPKLERRVMFEIKINISDKKIRVSNLPPVISEQTLKDKVELAFYKSSIGGGEIEAVDYDQHSNSAYVTYLDRGVAQRVLKRRYPSVMGGDVLHDVKTEPCTDVQLNKLQMFSDTSKRSVLLTGIRDIDLGEEDIQDLLQIHFQRTSNGGGEVETILYSKTDEKILIFQEDLNEA